MLAQIRGAVGGGVDVVQIREAGLEARTLAAFLRQCLDLMRDTNRRLIVNDRVDLALAVGAHGVHLRENSISIDAARRLAHSEFLVGRSVHDATAARAQTADYLIAGSVFATESKPGQERTLGRDGLRRVVDAAGNCPVWAVGGITAATVPDVWSCGVRGVAAIGAFLPPANTADVERVVGDQAATLRISLDQCG
jgi:thiamine-phosphate pyrophosphorylase